MAALQAAHRFGFRSGDLVLTGSLGGTVQTLRFAPVKNDGQPRLHPELHPPGAPMHVPSALRYGSLVQIGPGQ